MQKADRDRIQPEPPQLSAQSLEGRATEGKPEFPPGPAPFREAEPEPLGDPVAPGRRIQPEKMRPGLAAQNQDVLESRRRNQRRPSSASLKEGIGGDGGPVDDGGRPLEDTEVLEPPQDRPGRIVRR